MDARVKSIAAAILCGLLFSGCGAGHGAADATPLPAGAADWPMYQYSPDRNAVLAAPDLHASWNFDAKSQINGGLALVNGSLIVETFGKEVLALDARTGTPRWRAQGFKNILMTTPIVANGLVYVGTGANPMLDKGWNLMLRMQYRGKQLSGVPGGDEVAALDLSTGRARWRYHTVGENMPSPAYYRGRLVFANGDWHAYALRSDNGAVLWKTPLNGYSRMSNAALIGNAAVMGICGNGGIHTSSTVAIDADTGKVRWEAPYGHCDGSPAVGEGKVFVEGIEPGAGSNFGRNRIAALDAKTGKPVWTYVSPTYGVATSVGSSEGSAAGMYYDGTYYEALPLDNRFVAFDARTGRIRWQMHTSGPVKMSSVVANGTLYFGDTTGVLYIVDPRTGKLKNDRLFTSPFTTTPPIVAGHTLFVVNGTHVIALPV
jgi:outer membrane protein assembly factor BamB